MTLKETTRRLTDELLDFHLPRWAELPDIELYMDQVIALMGKYLGSRCSGSEKMLTPSMVNNYVKMGIMPPPVKKKYSRAHLAHLIIICVLKQVMPIPLVRELISASLTELDEQQLLDTFCDYYDVAATEAVRSVAERADIIESGGKTGRDLLAASCAIRSQLELLIAESLASEAEA